MLSNSIIVICSGNSIPFDTEKYKSDGMGLPLLLQEKIRDNFSVGINSFYRFGSKEITWIQFGDYQFYENNLEGLKNFPLVIGKVSPQLIEMGIIQENTILIPPSKVYDPVNCWKVGYKKCVKCKSDIKNTLSVCPKCHGKIFLANGFYTHLLTHIMTLTLCVALGFKKIFVLGLDCCETNGKTHFYQDLVKVEKKKGRLKSEWYGVGQNPNGYNTSQYNDQQRMNDLLAPHANEINNGVHIYNVSPNSNVNVFPKIDYPTFYEMVGKADIDVDARRKLIKEEIIKRVQL